MGVGIIGIAAGLWQFQSLIAQHTLLRNRTLFALALLFGSIFLLLLFVSEVLKTYKEIMYANITSRWTAPLFQIVGIIGVAAMTTAVTETVLLGMLAGLAGAVLTGIALIWSVTSFSVLNQSGDFGVIRRYTIYLGPAVIVFLFIGLQQGAYNLLMFTLSPVEAGVFGVGLIFASLTRVPLKTINQIFPQVASELYSDGHDGRIHGLYQSTSKIAFVLAFPVVIVIMVFHVELATLFATAYMPYALVFPVMMVAQLNGVIAGTVGYPLIMTDNERKNMWLQAALAPVTVTVMVSLTS